MKRDASHGSKSINTDQLELWRVFVSQSRSQLSKCTFFFYNTTSWVDATRVLNPSSQNSVLRPPVRSLCYPEVIGSGRFLLSQVQKAIDERRLGFCRMAEEVEE